MKRIRHAWIAAILGICLLPAAGRLAAGTTGKIEGLVIDRSTKQPLIGANVLVAGTSLGSVTDMDGTFMILNLPPGLYDVRVSMMGYQTLVTENLRVSIDMTTPFRAELASTVIESGEAVTVTAERPLVRKDMTSSLSTVGADEIRDLPVQSMEDVLELQAGVVRTGGQMHIRGGRASEIAYWVDGVSTTDVFNGSSGVTVENSAIQELQVVSGTFNAEYGQAMSGIVKVITKEGGSRLGGDVSGYVGDYFSGDDRFAILKRVNVVTDASGAPRAVGTLENPLKGFNPIANIEANLGGPVPFAGDRLTFFVNGRFVSNEGYLYGRRWFTTYGNPGDSAFVPMNPYQRTNLQGKLVYRLSRDITAKYNVFWNRWDNDRTYNKAYTYAPDGVPGQEGTGLTQIFELNHMLSPKTFYELRVNRFTNEYSQRLYESPYAKPDYFVRVYADAAAGLDGFEFDPNTADGQAQLEAVRSARRTYDFIPAPGGPLGYVSPDSNSAPTSFSFNKGGNLLNRYERSTGSWVGKLDLTSQINRVHQVKTGFEARFHELTLDSYTITPGTVPGTSEAIIPFQPDVPDISSVQREVYTRNPFEFSAYVQDKIELKDLIVNLGVRFDYFDSKGVVPADPKDPSIYTPMLEEHTFRPGTTDSLSVSERRALMEKKAKTSQAVSPRLGLSFPITDRGVIHFSYGHFFQIPDFQYLYSSPDFKLGMGGGNFTLSNAELKPQRTVQYEVGLQQQLTNDLGVDVSLFYRDVRDWVGQTPLQPTYNPAVQYVMFMNLDYENVRGVTVKLDKRMSRNWSVRVDYTFQRAEGTYTSPTDAYTAYTNHQQKRLALIPMGFDQPHTLNALVRCQFGQWMVSAIGQLTSGTPYTPSFPAGEAFGSAASKGLLQNSEYTPMRRNVDLTVNRGLSVGKLRVNAFVNVYNVFDFRDALSVYGDTEKADVTSTIDPKKQGYVASRIGTVEEWAKQPSWYSAPRQIQAGLSVGF
ncbi:MAG: TonB-dependent receptor [bacterium]|nr:TonB-dependent receptor [bacterium]